MSDVHWLKHNYLSTLLWRSIVSIVQWNVAKMHALSSQCLPDHLFLCNNIKSCNEFVWHLINGSSMEIVGTLQFKLKCGNIDRHLTQDLHGFCAYLECNLEQKMFRPQFGGKNETKFIFSIQVLSVVWFCKWLNKHKKMIQNCCFMHTLKVVTLTFY